MVLYIQEPGCATGAWSCLCVRASLSLSNGRRINEEVSKRNEAAWTQAGLHRA